MSLENQLEKLNGNLELLITALANVGASSAKVSEVDKVEKPKPKPKVKVKTKPKVEEVEAEAEAESEHSIDDVRAALKKYMDAKTPVEAKKLLKSVGATKITDVAVSEYDNLIATIEMEIGDE